MTSTTLDQANSNAAPAFACSRHGLCDSFMCPKCNAQAYDLSSARERREVREVRALLTKKRRGWPVVGFVLCGVLPGFLAGLAHGELAFVVDFVPAAVGLALGTIACRYAKAPALMRLDEMLRKGQL